jgi:hypothetical protein
MAWWRLGQVAVRPQGRSVKTRLQAMSYRNGL